ncbi:MAG TPA: 4-hydroxy-3-methylbut-2-enyl diphosphate reductase, partial [Hyphomicrobium sp.]|nr:4-hydroxy-3-methylbut-2-enyl diphosphate reductase [Hyphomicrobium sp.]
KSSNSLRLVEVASRAGCRFSFLVERAADIPWDKLEGAEAVGITAGASAPEVIVEEVVEAFRDRYDVTIDIVTTLEERVVFNVPREVRVGRAPAEQH